MRLILHIGMPKTGTTSIQESLHINRETLLRHGVYVPALLGRRNHRRFSMIFERPRVYRRWLGPYSANSSTEKRKRAKISGNLRHLKEDLRRASGNHSFVVSSEQMSWSYGASEIQSLAKVCHEHFSSIDVVIFLRPQTTAIPSRYWLSLKTTTLSKSFARWMKENALVNSRFDYAALLDMWAVNFPKAKLSPILMEDSRGFDSVDVFFRDALGLETSAVNILPVNRMNQSGSGFDIVALRALNHLVKIWLRLPTRRKLARRAVRAKRRLNRMIPLLKWATPFAVRERHLARIADHFHDSNRALALRFFSGRPVFERDRNR